ncbi:MAG: J domain-containing protein [Gemmataceae bacterium]
MSDPYDVLGIPDDADDAAIRTRYLELVKQYSPEQAPERFAAIRTAYEQLRDRDARLIHRLFAVGRRDTIESVIEDVTCRSPRRRVTFAELLKAAGC